ncbi:MAG TPA: FAD-dependent oxidoreductase [Desulfobacteraceae bacterium]|nr:FAD-dependent oxidoreductase [Desulfobacteraceae bacterium]HPJ67315.1 FAD-dependent oxidoreductase [Desulfobacteraceae bacterium]
MSENTTQEEALRLAALIAHQLKSPVGAAGSLLKTLLGEYVGHLNPQQKDLLDRADKRLQEAAKSVSRMLVIAQSDKIESDEGAISEVVSIVRSTQLSFSEDASARNISVILDITVEPAHVRVSESALSEALNAIVNNAFKYTPNNGQIKFTVKYLAEEDAILISIADSGIGVSEEFREKIFEPFFRSDAAQKTTLPGVGLGLTFAKSLVERAGGRIWVDKSEFGGADFCVVMPRIPASELPRKDAQKDKERSRVVIIGGVAAGPKIASKIIRVKPRTDVTVIEKGEFLSYAGCGLPYYVSGVVKEQKELLSTPLGIVRDPIFFQNVKSIKVMNRTEAMEIDRSEKRVRIKNLVSGQDTWIPYDKLAIATGATPVVPSIPGGHLKNIFKLHGVSDAEGIKSHVSRMKARDVVLIGGGLVSVEMTDALVACGCRVTIVELSDQILGILDWEMAALLTNYMESKGVRVITGTQPNSFLGTEFVEGVVIDKGILSADMVVLGVGVRPNVELAQNAGLEIGSTGAIKVDDHMCTSDPDIYAAGDCVENKDIVTGMPCYVPLGSTANKQGRIAAMNICEGDEIFPGIVGSTVCKVFDYCVARVGLTERWARKAGYDIVTVLTGAPDREQFMPEAQKIMLKLVVDRKTRKLLGVQAIGPGQGDKRVDVAATAITAGMTVDQIANLDLCYAPPYSLAMDNLITGANIAKNKLAGFFEGITPMEVYEKMRNKEKFILLDLSSPQEYANTRLPGSTLIPLGALRGRLNELPRDKEIITFCTNSIRGYEAALKLKAVGFTRVRVMDGGLIMWPYEKIHGMK